MLEYFRMVTSGILPEGYSKEKKSRQARNNSARESVIRLHSTYHSFYFKIKVSNNSVLRCLLLLSVLD